MRARGHSHSFKLTASAVLLTLTVAGCASQLGPEYLGVRSGEARYSVTFNGASGTLSASGTATVRQLGVTFDDKGLVEDSDTTSNLPRAVGHEVKEGTSTRASSRLEWREIDAVDPVVTFALKRVFRIVDFRPEEQGAATIEVQRVASEEPRVQAFAVVFTSAKTKARVELTLRPDVGLWTAHVTTDAGEWKVARERPPTG